MRKIIFASLFLLVISLSNLFSQVEYVPIYHSVYEYLKKLSLKDIISDFNSSVLPLSRKKVSNYLVEANMNKSMLSSIEKRILEDFLIEFQYDIEKKTDKSYSLINNFSKFDIFNNNKQKYLYSFTDSNSSLFWDLNGFVSFRGSKADSLGDNFITLGEIGIRIRGTLFNNVGYYLRLSNGQRFGGTQSDINFASEIDPILKANTKFSYENKNFDTYEGYLRFAAENEWISITAGKEALSMGFGYHDKLFYSNNTVPFSFLKLDLKYKSLSYYFLYGSLKGDSLGTDFKWKNIASHRLNLDITNKIRFGFFESLIISDDPFNFSFLNPISFLRSADYSAATDINKNVNNALLGFDTEIRPLRNLSVQASLLIDDLNFSTLFNNDKNGKPANDNRFGYQIGSYWTDMFSVPTLAISLEYTKLSPFVYTHRTNKSQYTHWGLPLGHNLPPNSDEISLRLSMNINKRLYISLLYQHQRSANRTITDGDTLIANYGGNINRGDGDLDRDNIFLSGDRVNRDIFTFNVLWQPIRQYYIDIKCICKFYDLIYDSRKLNDIFAFTTFRVDF